ncbi:MAG: TonB-dependent receptor [bacterium]|nr:TonB-dependent receptor [bacterium]
MKHKLFVLLIAVAMLCGGMLFAQEQSGEVIGTVVLEDGSAIPGVAVVATSPGQVGKRTTVTNEQGSFRFMALSSGTYEFSFILEGFKTKKRKDIVVNLGRTYKLDIVMETGAIRQEVVVTGKSPVIDVRKSSSTVNITKEEFKKLPKGRGFMTVITKTAGINFESEFQTADEKANGEFSAGVGFDGASSSENTFYVDGVDTTTLFTGKSGANVNFDFIEEVQVKSSGYAAEYGGSMGGVISVVTRSGGNEFHGNIIGYFDGSALGANPTPTLRINPIDEDVAEYITYPEDSWTRFEPGFGLGGYIIKDKLWFFGSFMPRVWKRTRDGSQYEDGTIFHDDPLGAADFTRTDTTLAGTMKLTGQLANNLRASLSGTIDLNKYRGDLPPRHGGGNSGVAWDDLGFDYPKYTFGGSLDYTVGNNLMINASGGYFRWNTKQLLEPPGARWFFRATNAGVPGAPEIKPLYWRNYEWADGFKVERVIENKMTANIGMTYYANMGGEHVFKAGIQLVKIGLDKSRSYPYDYYGFYWNRDYESPNLGTVPTTLGYVEVRDPYGSTADMTSNRWALYLQDSWTIGDKLTLNLGLRAESEEIPAMIPEIESFVKFDFSEKIAPRIGFAYDVFGDSSLKFFGSFGIYYDVMKLNFAESCFGADVWVNTYYDIVDPNWENFVEADHPITGGLNGGTYIEQRDMRSMDFTMIDPDMKPYQKNEFTFGVQKTLSEDWSLSGRFLYNWIVNAVEDIGIQTAHGEEYFKGNPGSDYINAKFDEAIALGLIPEGVHVAEAVRRYTSFTLTLDRKFKNNWMGGMSYTWSRLYGNFAGLASSDEHGRKDPGTERYFDGWFLTYNQNGEDYLGNLPTDRTHQFKFYGAYSFDFGLTVGFNAFAMTGTPQTTEVDMNGMQGYYPLGRGNLGRNDFLWQMDIYAEYNLKVSDKHTLSFSVNVTNVTDNQIASRTYQLYNGAGIFLPEETLRDGYDYLEEIAAKGAYLDPQYQMKYRYQDHIAARIGVKFMF